MGAPPFLQNSINKREVFPKVLESGLNGLLLSNKSDS
jgi:hypothetical protein